MNNEPINLFPLTHTQIIEVLEGGSYSWMYSYSKHQLLVLDVYKNELAYIRLPLHDVVEEVIEEPLVLYLSIESGNAVICVMEGEENVYHTTFSAYMVRKKQGFSQVKYLNKKGKSRAGSRMRLSSTIEFFESINTTLEELFEEFSIDRIALDCSLTLLPYLYNSKVECSFTKEDERLYKIPVHLPQANFTNLEKAIKRLKAPLLFAKDEVRKDLKAVFDLA